MNEAQTRNLIKEHEGFRNQVYRDSQGVTTIGWGHALHVGSTMPYAVLEMLFDYDYAIAEHGYNLLGLELDPVRRAAVINLIFNVGVNGVRAFKKMLAALTQDDWETAAKELLDSKYASQVGRRAKILAKMIETGEEPG